MNEPIQAESRPETQKTTKILNSDDLFQGRREIVIQHGNRQYRLLVTKSGKLILNK